MLSLSQESQRNMLTLALLKAIGSRATTITPHHSEIRNTKMTQSFQLFYEGIRNQQKKPLSLLGQFLKFYLDIQIFLNGVTCV